MAKHAEGVTDVKTLELHEWLSRLDDVHKALIGFAGQHGQPPRFGGMDQWFEALKGKTISVTPPPGVTLDGGHYHGWQELEDMQVSPMYSDDMPFLGGVALEAVITDHFLRRSQERGISADLICVQPNIGGGPVLYKRGTTPNRNLFADAVVIPSELRAEVAIALVDGSAQPIVHD